MRGRKPKPTAQRALEGNAGRRPFPTAEPQHAVVGVTFDVPPAELDDDAAAQGEWRRLAPLLRGARQITEADRAALIALCVEWSRYLEARRRAVPRVIASPSGYAMPNPWLSVQTKALAACLKLWAELGLTPSSRARVQVVDDGTDAFAEFFDAPLPQPFTSKQAQ